MAPLLIIAAGGTGGHMFPAQALAEEMISRGWRVKLSTDPRGRQYTGGFPNAVDVQVAASATFARGGAMAKLLVPFKIIMGVAAAKISMLRDRPAVVAGFGGYPSIPAMIAAVILWVPRVIHEQNAVPGRVNRLLAPFTNRRAFGIKPIGDVGRKPVSVTGNPVRSGVALLAGAPYRPAASGEINLVVFGGSQGARIISENVPGAVAAIPDQTRMRLRISHQARAEDHDQVMSAYDAAGVRAEIAPFFDDLPKRIADAHLVICRAGASSIADLSVIGRPSILIPFAAATGDHQTANADSLSSAGAAIVFSEAELDETGLGREIERILTSPEDAAKMAAAALSCGKPKAVNELADIVQSLGEGKKS